MRVSMEEALRDERALGIDPFYLIWSQILPLLQLEDVLLPIDDLEEYVRWVQLCHIPSMQPALLVDRLSR